MRNIERWGLPTVSPYCFIRCSAYQGDRKWNLKLSSAMYATVLYFSSHHGSLGQVDDPFLFTIRQQQFTPKTASRSNT